MCLDVLRGFLCWLQLFPQCCHKYPQGSHIVIPTAAPDILCDKGMGQYDKSNGFYRRQLLLTTKEKPVGRVDDPFLIDKMRGEKEGILLWALEGLHRLIQNNYQFTISERTAANLKEAMEQGNNILGFLKSESYFEIRQGAKCKSTDFYKVYERWCLDNLEKPLAASTFIHHLKDNQKSLGIVYDDKCIGTNRGFHNVDVDLFLPVDVPSPWD